ncbi:EGF-containing fibulin-like extracellular matrix protein 1 isoform X1 [Varroa jacobsoni]|uniref:Uncharacterized protein n=1 Tax=Varroa destructor TaxID=109461 RepID=A0A7M7JKB2_VARDE|nr:EGF-containing fibulin-like extracellular matrix protein 1 isoform X1 [Varroa destructor]XP_022696333.1 EGF-containing fibulin-like extracellular matrix protein 1 isoform X1 [Varroa jacobsoni]
MTISWLASIFLLIGSSECSDISRHDVDLPHLSGPDVADIVRQLGGLNFSLNSKPITNGEPKCKPGLEYESKSGYCVDVNECERGTHNCSHVALCVNHAGSFECVKLARKSVSCLPGYRFNWHLGECLEIDECVKKPCARSQTCVNEQNGFRCLNSSERSCPQGYSYQNRKGCVDINECQGLGAHLCDGRKELCKNLHGSYMCVPPCQKGFRMIPNIWDCADIDECMEETDSCAHNEECINTLGGYNCEMPLNTGSPSPSLTLEVK